MNCSVSPKKRREVLRADLDRMTYGSALWHEPTDEDPAHEARCAQVRYAVTHALTPKQREAVEMYFFEGCSQGEIAQRLGISQQVVQKRIFGATRDGRFVGGAIARLRCTLLP